MYTRNTWMSFCVLLFTLHVSLSMSSDNMQYSHNHGDRACLTLKLDTYHMTSTAPINLLIILLSHQRACSSKQLIMIDFLYSFLFVAGLSLEAGRRVFPTIYSAFHPTSPSCEHMYLLQQCCLSSIDWCALLIHIFVFPNTFIDDWKSPYCILLPCCQIHTLADSWSMPLLQKTFS